MNKSVSLRERSRIICPECSNFFEGSVKENGLVVGRCPVCRAVVSQKRCSVKVKQIKVIKDFAN